VRSSSFPLITRDAPVTFSCQAGETAITWGVDSVNQRAVVDAIPLVNGVKAADGQAPNGYQLRFNNDNSGTLFLTCMS
jgi:hypothetical protein